MPGLLASAGPRLALCSFLLLVSPLAASVVGEGQAVGAAERGRAEPGPFLVPLRRELVPVVRGGRTVAHKSAYYGTVSLGAARPQEFSVVFDTGSGHVVVPSVDCKSEACLTKRRYNLTASEGASAINLGGQPVPPDELCDQVTIGFGTGTVTGEFAHERVCAGGALQAAAGRKAEPPCGVMRVVMAVEMSEQPFKSFHFDGIFGLGLSSLALKPEFSFFGELARVSASIVPRFGIYLAGGQDGEELSEIAMGGHNAARVRGPLAWAPVSNPQLGYWQIQVLSVHVGGREVALCRSNACRAIVDTGTSHLGVPKQHLAGLSELLSAPAMGDDVDCRQAAAPVLSIRVAPNLTLELRPEDYMREEPYRSSRSLREAAAPDVRGLCKPRLMPVNLQAPLGPNLFILGEPVLRRYYTVYDWKDPHVGFGIAQGRNGVVEELVPPDAGAPDEAEAEHLAGVYLVQVELSFVVRQL